MDAATKILVLGGVLNLAYSFLTGIFLGVVRQNSPTASKYLVFAHTGPLMQGAMLLGLVFALQVSPMDANIETLAAALLVGGSILLAFKDTLNWRQKINDEFQERPPGFLIGGLSAVASIAGLLLVIIGVFQGL